MKIYPGKSVSLNRPFAASHLLGTKPSCWDAKVALGQDKQRKLSFKIMYAICWSCPSVFVIMQKIKGSIEKLVCVIVSTFLIFMFVDQLLLVEVFSQCSCTI